MWSAESSLNRRANTEQLVGAFCCTYPFSQSSLAARVTREEAETNQVYGNMRITVVMLHTGSSPCPVLVGETHRDFESGGQDGIACIMHV